MWYQAEPVALGLGGHQPADEIWSRLLSALVCEIRDVRPEGQGGGMRRVLGLRIVGPDAGLSSSSRIHSWKSARSPYRHPEELADHRDRQRVSEVRDQVHSALMRGGVQQLGHDLVDSSPQSLDRPGSERLVDQRPQPGVVGRILAQHEVDEEQLAGVDAGGLQLPLKRAPNRPPCCRSARGREGRLRPPRSERASPRCRESEDRSRS